MKAPNKTILTIILTAVFVLLLYTVALLLLREPQVLLPEVLPTGELTEEELVVQVEQKEPEIIYVSCGSNMKMIDGIPVQLNILQTIGISHENGLIFKYNSNADYEYGEVEYMNWKTAHERRLEIMRKQNSDQEEI